MLAKVPLLDLSAEMQQIGEEIEDAVRAVLRSGRFVLGPNAEALEAEIADYLGVAHAVGLNSGTDALVIGLEALGIGPGDEVITTPLSFVGTAEAIRTVGATPVFVDIDPPTFNLDPSRIGSALTERTRAILPVHLFGQVADMDPILELARRKGLRVLEDAAQAIGAEYGGRRAGALADAAAFSFFPTKNLAAYGDGGMLVTDDASIAAAARELRNHGALDKYRTGRIGHNSRLDEIQAAVLRVKLPRLEAWTDIRRANAIRYGRALASLDGLTPPSEMPNGRHAWHQYTVRISGGRRDAVRDALEGAGIATGLYYPVPLHQLTPYVPERPVTMPEAERAASEVLSLPIAPTLRDEQIGRVIEELQGLFGA